MALAERLRYARERAGLTGVQVHERVGIGESSLSEFENGKREPKLSQLHILGKAYGRPVTFFLADGPIPREVVLWREVPPEGFEETENCFLRLCHQYHNLEVWTDEAAPGDLPYEKADATSYEYPDAVALAKRVRDELQLGDRPGQVLLRILEEVLRVKVFHSEFEPSGTAVSTKSETFGPAILLNTSNVRWRRNFDLAHELFHLLTWDTFRHGAEQPGAVASKPEDSLATCFASNLLMPSDVTGVEIERHSKDGSVSCEVLYDIARQFDVSTDALLWRAHMLYRMPSDTEKTRKDIETVSRWEATHGTRSQEDATPPKYPDRYWALGLKALRRGVISTGRFAEYMDISRRQATKLSEQEATGCEEVEIAPA